MKSSQTLKALLLAGLLAGPMLAFNAMSQNREDIQWSPLNTWTDGSGNTYASWDDGNNWAGGVVPAVVDTNAAGPAFFNAAYNSTVICVVSNAEPVTGIGQLMCGFGGAGTLLITNGAHFQAGFCYGGNWTGIGFVAGPGTLIVGPGSDFTCDSHLWVGQGTADQGTVDINGGTIHIPNGQLGVSWNGIGGTNYITIENGGALYLSQWASKTLGAPGSPGNVGIMNIGANSQVVITNNALSYMPVLIASNQLIAFGGQGQIQASYNPTLNITTLIAVAPPGPDTPQFSVQPTNLIVKLGATATLSAAASPATGYQWMFNSSPLTDGNGISGSHTANLTVANFSAAETGLYSVVATNASPASQNDRPFNSSQTVSVTAESFSLFPVVTVNGVPGNTYVTQYATSLSGPWTSFSTNTVGAGPLYVVDTTSPLSMVKFYRVIQTSP